MEQMIFAPEIPTKIGIIGTKNVGKTTLASLLNGHLRTLGVNSNLVHESSRYCPLPLKEETTIDSSYWIFGSQIASEALSSAAKPFTICDRTVIDLYPFAAYSLLHREQNSDERILENTRKLQGLKTLISDYLKARPYDFLFYLPIRHEYEQNYSSQDGIDFQIAIDERFRAFLFELQVSYYELKELSTHDRLEEVVNYMSANMPMLSD